jgi:hypothetical protein
VWCLLKIRGKKSFWCLGLNHHPKLFNPMCYSFPNPTFKVGLLPLLNEGILLVVVFSTPSLIKGNQIQIIFWLVRSSLTWRALSVSEFLFWSLPGRSHQLLSVPLTFFCWLSLSWNVDFTDLVHQERPI